MAACAPTLPKLVMRRIGEENKLPANQSPCTAKKSASLGYRTFDIDSNETPMAMDAVHNRVDITKQIQVSGNWV